MIQLRDGSTTVDPRTDRIQWFDPKSRDHQIREELRASGLPIRERGRYHLPGPTLDQLKEGQCVSEATHDAANGSPNRLKPPVVSFELRRNAYHQMQHDDPWRGCYLGARCPVAPDAANAYGGTAVLAGMRYGKEKGYWSSYKWVGAGSGRLEDDIIDTLTTVGGIVFGIPWLEGMYETQPDGLVRVEGNEVGGHAIHGWEYIPRLRLPKSFEGTKRAVALHNSWGPSYGVRRRRVTGVGFVLVDDLLGLMERGGEGAVPLA